MRRKVTVESLRRFMKEFATAVQSPGKVYLTGGATALLLGFRDQTIDIDVKLDPEPKGAFEAIARLKDKLDLNIELASPDDFIPAPPDWRESSRLINVINGVEFRHYDLTMQVLAKLERGHAQDVDDALKFARGGYVGVEQLRRRLTEIEPRLLRYPAVDPQQFKRNVEAFLARLADEPHR